jgi:multiple sugar transport system substrate-binding protein
MHTRRCLVRLYITLILVVGLVVMISGLAMAKQVELKWLMRSNPFENKWQREVVVPKFEALHPNIKINLIVVPFDDVDPKLSVMVAAGDPPDIFSQWGASGFNDYYRRNLLLELTEYIERDMNKDDFVPGIFDIYAVNGKYYSVPQVTNFGNMMVYNKDLFAQAGLPDLPCDWNDPSWTWDEMVNYAKKLTKDYGKGLQAQYGIAATREVHHWAYIWGADPYLPEHYTTGIAPKSNLDDPDVIAALQAVADLTYKHKVAPNPAETTALETLGHIFSTGKVGMAFSLSTQAYGNFQEAPFQWGLAPVPRVRDNKTALYNGTWFIAKDSKHKDEAWTFVKYLLTEEAARDMSVATGFLVPHRATVDDWIELFVEPTGMDVASLLQVITQYPENCVENTNHLFVDWPQINTTLTQGLDALWLGKVDAETAISEVKPRVDQIIARTYEKYKDR